MKISAVDPDSRDARSCLDAYFQELATTFANGFDPRAGKSIEAPARQVFLIAYDDGRPLGCGTLRTIGPGIGEIKRMWVATEMRGKGLSRKILDRLEEHAREWGMEKLRLDTNRALLRAQSIYRTAGYVPIARYNDNPYADHWFEKVL